jgi:hypothetical protein
MFTNGKHTLQCSYEAVTRSISVRPSIQGVIGIVQSLCMLGTITASCAVMGYTRTSNWMTLPIVVTDPSSSWFRKFQLSHQEKNPNECIASNKISTQPSNINRNHIAQDNDTPPSATARRIGTTMLRVLLIPSLCEELLWRVILQPPQSSVRRIVWINGLYAVSHVVLAEVLLVFIYLLLVCLPSSSSSLLSLLNRHTTSSSTETSTTFVTSANRVFTDPSFLGISFVLGNLCSYSYIRSGYALYAPVLVHSIAVSIWLTTLGGNAALGRNV